MNIDDINAAFADVKYPENGFLGETRPSEWDYIYQRLRGKNWRDLRAEDLDCQGGIIEGIQSLNVEAFVYFLPGMLNLILKDFSPGYVILDGILSRLTRSEREPGASLTIQDSVMALLSDKQRQFLIGFLVESARSEPTLCPIILDSAIQNLRNGKISPYRRDDILNWARQIKQ